MSLSNNDWKESTGSLRVAGEAGRMAPILAPIDELEAAKLHQRVLLKYKREICAQFSKRAMRPGPRGDGAKTSGNSRASPPPKKKTIKRKIETQINAGPGPGPLPQQYQNIEEYDIVAWGPRRRSA